MPAPSAAEKEELAITYAALILHDDSLPITEENLNKILDAASVKIPAFWPKVFAKILSDKDSSAIDDILLGGGGAPAVGGAPAAGGDAPAAAEAAAPAAVEEEEESDEEMGFGLFD